MYSPHTGLLHLNKLHYKMMHLNLLPLNSTNLCTYIAKVECHRYHDIYKKVKKILTINCIHPLWTCGTQHKVEPI